MVSGQELGAEEEREVLDVEYLAAVIDGVVNLVRQRGNEVWSDSAVEAFEAESVSSSDLNELIAEDFIVEASWTLGVGGHGDDLFWVFH